MLEGIQFPLNNSGKRSTAQVGQSVFASASTDCQLSHEILAQSHWRKHYHKYMPRLEKLAAADFKVAENMAQKGLSACYGQFEFHRDGKVFKLKQAMDYFDQAYFHTATIQGKAAQSAGLEVKHKGRTLRGSALRAQVQVWLDNGIIEKSHAHDLFSIFNDAEKLDLSNRQFVLLGAGSEIGPYAMLMALGASVVAVGRASRDNWMRLINIAQTSPGTLHIPCRCDASNLTAEEIAEVAGADLLIQTPEIANWINRFEQPLTIGNYAYLDGAKHVQVSMAMDAISRQLLDKRSDVSLAYLLTPTDVYAVPQSVVQISKGKYRKNTLAGMGKKLIRFLTQGALFSPSIVSELKDQDHRLIGILDNLVPQQGPNYVLAKRIQRWRAMDSVKQGVRVSCNVAPASSTASVMSNQFFLAASKGSESFGVEVFTPNTANTLMTLQMIADIKGQQPQQRGESLFVHGANHGGAWQIGYCFRSMLVPSLLVGFAQKLWPKKRQQVMDLNETQAGA